MKNYNKPFSDFSCARNSFNPNLLNIGFSVFYPDSVLAFKLLQKT